MDKFIYSLGIRFIGEINAEILAKEFKNIDNFISLSDNTSTLANIDGLGPKAISSIIEYFSHTQNLSLVKKFSLRGVPTTILFDKEGREFARILGSIDFRDQGFMEWLRFYN